MRAIAEIKQSDTEAWIRCARMLTGLHPSIIINDHQWKNVQGL